ncbi:transposase [Citrobacter freundii]|nr:transposase [Citrobacter freundii]
MTITVGCPQTNRKTDTGKTLKPWPVLVDHYNFSAEFKRESAQLVVDQNYTVADAAKAMDVGLSTMTRWVKQLRDERQGKTPKASPITPEQIEIRELRKKLQRIEMENEILKKATVDSIGQRNSYVKTWGCGGFLNETNIYSRGKSLCF